MTVSDNEKTAEPVVANPEIQPDESDSDNISQDAQDGVKKMEATTKVWTKTALIVAYVMYVQSSSYSNLPPEFY